MRRTLHTLTVISIASVSILLGSAAVASVGGATAQDDHPWENEAGQPNAEVTRMVTLLITEVGEDNTVVFLDPKTEQRTVIQLSDEVPLRAKSKKLFEGRKKLAFDDLEKGQKVRISFRADDGAILRLTVLKRA